MRSVSACLYRATLPDDADLRKERSDEIPEAAKEIMREMGINPETWEY